MLNNRFQLNYDDSDEMMRECLINLIDEDVRNASVNCGNCCSQLLFIMSLLLMNRLFKFCAFSICLNTSGDVMIKRKKVSKGPLDTMTHLK